VYRAEVGDALPPGLPDEAAAAARDTLGGAVGAADSLPASVVEAAGDAFVQGLQLAALTGAVLMAATAGVTALVLRRHAGPADGATAAC
jgi:DHA2 family multidrug resistance protein-like MFS transporter